MKKQQRKKLRKIINDGKDNTKKGIKEEKMAKNTKKWLKCAILTVSMAFILFLVLLFPVSALQKPVEGYVFEGTGPLKDAKITALMRFEEGGREVICLTYPEIFTDERGYFITNLANLRVMGNNNPCEEKWKEGDALAIIAKGFFTRLPSDDNILIDSESGAPMTLERLVVTDKKFDALYSQLSIARLKILSINHTVSWKSKKAIFDAEIYNPNNVPVEDLFLKVVIAKKDDKSDIVGIAKEGFGIDAFGKKRVQILWDVKDVAYGSYSYDAVLYTTTTNHDTITGREIELKPFLGFITFQNILILVMAAIIAILLVVQLRSKKKEKKQMLERGK